MKKIIFIDPSTGQENTISKFAKEHGLSYMCVRRRLREYGNPFGNVDAFGRKRPARNISMFETGGIQVPLAEYAKAIGTSVFSLKRWKRRFGTLDGYEKFKRYDEVPPKTFGTINGERVGLRKWAKENGFSFSAVYHHARRHDGVLDGFLAKQVRREPT